MISKETGINQLSSIIDDKENHIGANKDKLSNSHKTKTNNDRKYCQINENYATSNSKWIEVVSECEFDNEFPSMPIKLKIIVKLNRNRNINKYLP